MKKYVLIFTVAYLLLTVTLAIAATLLKVNSGTLLNLGVAIASSFFAAWQFTKEHARIPTREENTAYARLALVATWGVSAFLVVSFLAIFLSPAELEAFRKLMTTKMFLAVAPVACIVLSVIYYFVIKWSFSWSAKQIYKHSLRLIQ